MLSQNFRNLATIDANLYLALMYIEQGDYYSSCKVIRKTREIVGYNDFMIKFGFSEEITDEIRNKVIESIKEGINDNL